MVLASLSNLSKFLGRYDEFRMLVHRFGVKWSSRDVRDRRLIDRIRKVDSSPIFEWIRRVKRFRPELSALMDLMVVTGMRMLEAINSYNLIIQLSRERRLNEYYDWDKEILEHYKFKDLFLRKSKKAFISFCQKYLIQQISMGEPLSKGMIDMRLKRSGLPLRFSDIREVWASLMTKYLSQPEIDFL